MNAQSQCEQIAQRLETGCCITSLSALRDFDCLNLKGRIFDLRNLHGKFCLTIYTNMKKVGSKTFAHYSLSKF